MQDPYEVLGVPRTATEDEIKAAYRTLAKRYHPDLHPGDEEAARRMNEINAAYDAIKNPQPQRQSAGAASGYGDPFGFGYAYYEDRDNTRYETRESPEIQSAMRYVTGGAYAEALHVLSTVPAGDRDGVWYYWSARANLGLGNRVAALEHIRRAVNLEPDNLRYQRLYQVLQTGGHVYTDAGTRHGYSAGFGTGNYCYPLCSALCLANLCCGGNYYWFCC